MPDTQPKQKDLFEEVFGPTTEEKEAGATPKVEREQQPAPDTGLFDEVFDPITEEEGAGSDLFDQVFATPKVERKPQPEPAPAAKPQPEPDTGLFDEVFSDTTVSNPPEPRPAPRSFDELARQIYIQEVEKEIEVLIDRAGRRELDEWADALYDRAGNLIGVVGKPVMGGAAKVGDFLSRVNFAEVGFIDELLDVARERGFGIKQVTAALSAESDVDKALMASNILLSLTEQDGLALIKEATSRAFGRAKAEFTAPIGPVDVDSDGVEKLSFTDLFERVGIPEGPSLSEVLDKVDLGTDEDGNQITLGNLVYAKEGRHTFSQEGLRRGLLNKLRPNRGGLFDPSARSAVGLIADIGLDPTTYLGVGVVGGGLRVSTRGGTRWASKSGVRWIGTKMDEITEMTRAGKVVFKGGEHLPRTRKTIYDVLDELGEADLERLALQMGVSIKPRRPAFTGRPRKEILNEITESIVAGGIDATDHPALTSKIRQRIRQDVNEDWARAATQDASLEVARGALWGLPGTFRKADPLSARASAWLSTRTAMALHGINNTRLGNWAFQRLERTLQGWDWLIGQQFGRFGDFRTVSRRDPLFREMYEAAATDLAYTRIKHQRQTAEAFRNVDLSSTNRLEILSFADQMLVLGGPNKWSRARRELWQAADEQTRRAARYVADTIRNQRALEMKLGISGRRKPEGIRELDRAAIEAGLKKRDPRVTGLSVAAFGEMGIIYRFRNPNRQAKRILNEMISLPEVPDDLRVILADAIEDAAGNVGLPTMHYFRRAVNLSEKLKKQGKISRVLEPLDDPRALLDDYLHDSTGRVSWERLRRTVGDKFSKTSKIDPEVLYRISQPLVKTDAEFVNVRKQINKMEGKPQDLIRNEVPLTAVDSTAFDKAMRALKTVAERREMTRQLALRSETPKVLLSVMTQAAKWDAIPTPRGFRHAAFGPEEYAPVMIGGKEVELPKSIAEDLRDMPEEFLKNREFNAFVQVWDRLNLGFKSYHTVMFPDFVLRNAYSNVMFHSLAHGVNFWRNHLRAQAIIHNLTPNKILKTPTGDFTYGELREAMLRGGVIQEKSRAAGLRVAEAREASNAIRNNGNPAARFSKANLRGVSAALDAPTVPGRWASGLFENWERASIFLNSLRRGESFEQAAATTNKFLVDYSNVSKFERGLKRGPLPFLTWSFRMIPVMVGQTWQNPGALAAYHKVTRLRDGEEQYLPSWKINDGTRLRIREADDGRVQVLEGIETPLAVFRVFDQVFSEDGFQPVRGTFKALFAMAGPVIKESVKIVQEGDETSEIRRRRAHLLGYLVENTSLGSNQRFINYFGIAQDTRTGEWMMNERLYDNWLSAWFLGRALRKGDDLVRLAHEDPGTANLFIKMLDALTTAEGGMGLEVVHIDPDIFGEDRMLRLNELKRQLEEALVMAGDRRPVSFTVPSSELPPDEAQ